MIEDLELSIEILKQEILQKLDEKDEDRKEEINEYEL